MKDILINEHNKKVKTLFNDINALEKVFNSKLIRINKEIKIINKVKYYNKDLDSLKSLKNIRNNLFLFLTRTRVLLSSLIKSKETISQIDLDINLNLYFDLKDSYFKLSKEL